MTNHMIRAVDSRDLICGDIVTESVFSALSIFGFFTFTLISLGLGRGDL